VTSERKAQCSQCPTRGSNPAESPSPCTDSTAIGSTEKPKETSGELGVKAVSSRSSKRPPVTTQRKAFLTFLKKMILFPGYCKGHPEGTEISEVQATIGEAKTMKSPRSSSLGDTFLEGSSKEWSLILRDLQNERCRRDLRDQRDLARSTSENSSII